MAAASTTSSSFSFSCATWVFYETTRRPSIISKRPKAAILFFLFFSGSLSLSPGFQQRMGRKGGVGEHLKTRGKEERNIKRRTEDPSWETWVSFRTMSVSPSLESLLDPLLWILCKTGGTASHWKTCEAAPLKTGSNVSTLAAGQSGAGPPAIAVDESSRNIESRARTIEKEQDDQFFLFNSFFFLSGRGLAQ